MTPSTPFAHEWLQAALYFAGIFMALAVGWKSLTSRGSRTQIEGQPVGVELTDPSVRRSELASVRGEITELRQAMKSSLELGETRSVALHNRINDVVENTAEIKGRMESFTASFTTFNNVVSACLWNRGKPS